MTARRIGLVSVALALAACTPASDPPAVPSRASAPATPPVVTVTTPDAPAPTAAATPPPTATPLGTLTFPVTGNADCQRLFRDGVLALHSFLYDQAHESFVAAAAADPACTMAYWGDAMSFDHPVWHERDLAKGRAALAKVAHDEALTPKERAYLGVARALYAKDDLKAAHEAWLVAAAKMHGDFADDDEVALQHALALIAVHGYDRDHVREQMEAGTIALEVLHRNPSHPGAAHYAIHAFDSREHAILALEAAKTYAAIAPAGGHAQHMPSHTFVHLGMWREVVPSNEKAWASSVAWEKARGHSAGKYDWHSYSWLVAANLELGHVARAKQLIDDARALVLATKDDAADMRAALVDMVADYALTTGRWSEVESLVAPVFTPVADEGGPGGAVACAAHAPGAGGEVRMPEALIARIDANNLRAQAAIHAGDEATAKARVADMVAVEKQMGPWSSMLSPSTRARWEARDAALLARAHAGPKARPADVKRAIDAIEKHMNAEELRPIAGPAFYEPPREALGNALLAAGRAKDAVAVFEREIEQRPNRALALLGAARAAKAAGDGATARAHYATLVELWRDADVGFDLVAEARDGAK